MVVLLSSCTTRPQVQPAPKLTVAAASNLTGVVNEAAQAFTQRTSIEVVFSFGNTAQLAQQIENGAPFDVFAAADTEHVDTLVKSGKLTRGSRAIYALGQLALWVPKGDQINVHTLPDLASPKVRFIAIAQPELAPYGQAAVEALTASGLLDQVRPKFVYANSISAAKQFADSGNADAAFSAYSLVLHESGTVLKVDSRLHKPIEQALAVVSSSSLVPEAQRFCSFLLGPEGRAIFAKNGYLPP